MILSIHYFSYGVGSMNNRSGVLRSNLSGEAQYYSFVPSNLPPNPSIEFDDDMVSLLTKANRNIGLLEGVSARLPNIEHFVSTCICKEALLSSQIEGTQATLDDILDPKIESNTNQNISDVINCIATSKYAINRMRDLTICNRLLKETHAILLQNIRGEGKTSGEFRRSQNWIGAPGSTIKTSSFIPPNPEDMLQSLSDLEEYINKSDNLEPMVKIALIHYQFETIHPFLDGNGRISRLLILLLLIDRKLLNHETLYISCYFKRNRIEYYDRLMDVRNKGSYEQWIKFFLLALYESAKDAVATIDLLVNLHIKNISKIKQTYPQSKSVLVLFDYIEENPIIDIKKTSIDLSLSYNTVASALNKLITLDILRQTENVRRNRVYSYVEYLETMRKDT